MFFIHGLYVTYLRSLAIVGYLTTGRICVHENGESERVYVIRNALRCWSVKWVYFRQSTLPLQNRNPYTHKKKFPSLKELNWREALFEIVSVAILFTHRFGVPRYHAVLTRLIWHTGNHPPRACWKERSPCTSKNWAGSYRIEPCGKKPKNNASLSFLTNASECTKMARAAAASLVSVTFFQSHTMPAAFRRTVLPCCRRCCQILSHCHSYGLWPGAFFGYEIHQNGYS